LRKYLAVLGTAGLVVALCGVGAQSALAQGTLPSPWTDTDVGSPALAGSASYDSGVFTVNGSGVDIWGTSDQFNYVSQPMTENETIVARVTSQTDTDPWAKAGVMIKQSTTAGSTYALLAVTPGNGVSFQYGFNSFTSGTSYTFPAWLKLTLTGGNGAVTAYSSPDGINWTEVGSTNISLSYPATIGLFTTSHNPAAISTATFDNVSVVPSTGSGEQPPAGVVSSVPADNTPHFKATQTSPDAVEQIRQLVQCGNTMYAVGSFTSIMHGSTAYPRENIFSFSATAPYTVTSWAPDVEGTYGTTSDTSDVINTIALNSTCTDAYIGGKFTSVNGTTVQNIAEIDTSTGNVVSTFASKASGAVQTILSVGTHLLVGGLFTGINGDTTDPYMASLSQTTGKSDGFLHLAISGNYNFSGASSNPTQVFNQQLSHGGTLDLVEGDFTSVGGLPRQQIFMLNLATTPASVTAWSSPQWDGSQGECAYDPDLDAVTGVSCAPANDTPGSTPGGGYPYQCYGGESFYIQAAAWSADDSEVYIATTGYHPNTWPTGSYPRNGLCDASAAFPATQAEVTDSWINYTGCDSLYAAAADSDGAYFAGHERYSMNEPVGCDGLGDGYNAPGMEGNDLATGALFLNSAGTAGYYSRDRGLGADDMLDTSAGLWIASDNLDGSQMCGGVENLSGICFLPYT
jgi:hypothetical protein